MNRSNTVSSIVPETRVTTPRIAMALTILLAIPATIATAQALDSPGEEDPYTLRQHFYIDLQNLRTAGKEFRAANGVYTPNPSRLTPRLAYSPRGMMIYLTMLALCANKSESENSTLFQTCPPLYDEALQSRLRTLGTLEDGARVEGQWLDDTRPRLGVSYSIQIPELGLICAIRVREAVQPEPIQCFDNSRGEYFVQDSPIVPRITQSHLRALLRFGRTHPLPPDSVDQFFPRESEE